MTNLVEKTRTQRKTFTIPNYIVKELEDYSSLHNKKQSQVIAIALENFLYKQNREDMVKKRVKALESLIGILPKGITKEQKIQDILSTKGAEGA